MTVGERLRFYREQHGISQENLEPLVNIKQQALSRMEKTESNQVIECWIRLARFYGLTVEELYCGKPPSSFSKKTA